jgi:hypothetical protein
MRDRRDKYSVLVRKLEGKRSLGRPTRIWENNIKMRVQEIGWGRGVDCSGSRYELVPSYCERGNEPPGLIKCGEFFE